MIRIDLATAIALFFSFFLLIVFIHWIFYNWNKCSVSNKDLQFFIRCPFCTNLFPDYRDSFELKRCPRCHSLISKTQEDENDEKKKQP